MNATLEFAATSMRGNLHGDDVSFDGVSTDSRSLKAGQLFFALSGPNFDGADYVGAAQRKGAAGAVVASLLDADIAQITVADTKRALGLLGAAWRDTKTATIVGITGSNGKTTLKEMTAACLAAAAPTLATEGNLNNDIGMPLMLLRIEDTHRFVVLEMGANHAGEIAYLTSLARPDVVAITNAGAAHLEGFGSIEGVAKAKGEILQNEVRPRTVVLNADDDYFDYWRTLVTDTDVLSFGLGARADVRAERIEASAGRTDFTLQLPAAAIDVSLPFVGTHNVQNACAAAALASALGITAEQIRVALEGLSPVAGRLQPLPGHAGATLYDDSYNANPRSVIAAAEFLAALPGESRFVLGDMFELGDDAAKLHFDVGAAIRAAGVDRLLTLGELSENAAAGFGSEARSFDAIDALIDAAGSDLSPAVNLLVKGSRGMRMERVVEALLAREQVSEGA